MQIATLLGAYWSPDGFAVALVTAALVALVALAAIGARRIGDEEATPN